MSNTVFGLGVDDQLSPALKKAQQEMSILSKSAINLKSKIQDMQDNKAGIIDATVIQKENKEIKKLQYELGVLYEKNAKANTINRKKREILVAYNKELTVYKRKLDAVKDSQSHVNKIIKEENALRDKAKGKIKAETAAIDKSNTSRQKENASRRSASTSVIRHIRQLESLAVAYYSIKTVMDHLVTKGIQLNKTVEDGKTGIAALISANTTGGTDLERFQASLGKSEQLMKDLKKASVETAATFPQLTEVFQQAIGSSLGAGKAMGNSLDQITKRTITIAKQMTNIAASIGMPMAQVNEEIRSIMEGTVDVNSRIAKMLHITNKDIKQAKLSADGLFNFLQDKLKSFDALAGEQTMGRVVARFTDALDTMRLDATKPIFDDLKVEIADVTDYIKEHSDEWVEAYQNTYYSMKQSYDLISPSLESIKGLIDEVSNSIVYMNETSNEAVKSGSGLSILGNFIAALSFAVETLRVGIHNTMALIKNLPKPSGNVFVDITRLMKTDMGDVDKTLQKVNKDTITFSEYMDRIKSSYKKINNASINPIDYKALNVGDKFSMGKSSSNEDLKTKVNEATAYYDMLKQKAGNNSKAIIAIEKAKNDVLHKISSEQVANSIELEIRKNTETTNKLQMDELAMNSTERLKLISIKLALAYGLTTREIKTLTEAETATLLTQEDVIGLASKKNEILLEVSQRVNEETSYIQENSNILSKNTEIQNQNNIVKSEAVQKTNELTEAAWELYDAQGNINESTKSETLGMLDEGYTYTVFTPANNIFGSFNNEIDNSVSYVDSFNSTINEIDNTMSEFNKTISATMGQLSSSMSSLSSFSSKNKYSATPNYESSFMDAINASRELIANPLGVSETDNFVNTYNTFIDSADSYLGNTSNFGSSAEAAFAQAQVAQQESILSDTALMTYDVQEETKKLLEVISSSLDDGFLTQEEKDKIAGTAESVNSKNDSLLNSQGALASAINTQEYYNNTGLATDKNISLQEYYNNSGLYKGGKISVSETNPLSGFALNSALVGTNSVSSAIEEIDASTDMESTISAVEKIQKAVNGTTGATSGASVLSALGGKSSGGKTIANLQVESVRKNYSYYKDADGNIQDGTNLINGGEHTFYSYYKQGGYTGNYGVDEEVGIVHGQEYVINAQTTSDLGLNGSGGVFHGILSELKSLRAVTIAQANELRTLRKEAQDQTQILQDIEAVA